MTDGYAGGHGIMGPVSSETEARVLRAAERYAKADEELKAARTELVDAMIEHQDDAPPDGERLSNEKVARLTTLSNTQVFRLLKAERAKRATAKP